MSAALIKLVVHTLLAAASPSASNFALLAERFGAENWRISPIILLSTVLAFSVFRLRWHADLSLTLASAVPVQHQGVVFIAIFLP